MLDLQKRRVQLLLFIVALIALSMTAEKARELVGEEASSKSGKFTFFNYFDMGTGSLAFAVKEGVKLYVYSIRSAHVEKVRQRAIEVALHEALTEGLGPSDAAKQAQKVGAKAAKLASRQAKRILGPIISSGWDFFEAVYYGGTMTEGFLRGTGTLFGTYAGGFHGEQRLGKLGYLAGSHLGSWVGGRIGLMVYDIVNGAHYLLQFVQPEENASSGDANEESGSAHEYETAQNSEHRNSEDTNGMTHNIEDESVQPEEDISSSDANEESGSGNVDESAQDSESGNVDESAQDSEYGNTEDTDIRTQDGETESPVEETGYYETPNEYTDYYENSEL